MFSIPDKWMEIEEVSVFFSLLLALGFIQITWEPSEYKVDVNRTGSRYFRHRIISLVKSDYDWADCGIFALRLSDGFHVLIVLELGSSVPSENGYVVEAKIFHGTPEEIIRESKEFVKGELENLIPEEEEMKEPLRLFERSLRATLHELKTWKPK